jgi:hypothetical protein
MFDAISEELDWLLELVRLLLSSNLAETSSDSFSSGMYSEDSKLEDLDLADVGVEMLSLEGLLGFPCLRKQTASTKKIATWFYSLLGILGRS